MISALGIDVAVRCRGRVVAPENRVSNRHTSIVFRSRSDGRSLEPEWIERHVGIVERRLDLDFDVYSKRSWGGRRLERR